MGKKSGGSPSYPDPSKTAAQQNVLNEQTARTNATLNRINQYTPYGQSVYTDMGKQWASANPGKPAGQNPFKDQWRNDIILSPDSEAAAKSEMLNSRMLQELGTGQIGRIGESVSAPMDFSGLPQMAGSGGYAGDRQKVEDALYGRASSRLDPQFQQQQRALETSLANKGITMGSEAWNQAMDQFGRTRNDAYSSARADAISGGGAEQSRLFGLDLGARQQGISEIMAKRNQPLNELSAILSGGQVSMPQFSAAGQGSVAPVDYSSLVANKYGAQSGAAQQSNANWTNGLFGLAQAGLSAYMGS
jgi:hypothetical protein